LETEVARQFPSRPITPSVSGREQIDAERRFRNDWLYDHLDEEVAENEKAAFASYKFCYMPQLNISEVDWEKLNFELEEDRFNPELLKAMACLTTTAVVTPGPDGPTFVPDHVRTWIKNLKVLSAGSYGETFTASLAKSSPNLVIKTPIDDSPSTLAALFHEMIVGFFLNNLRAKTSGFAYVYSGFTSSLPLLGGQAMKPVNVLSYANFEAPIQYLIYERIAPSKTCGDFFDKPFNPQAPRFSFDRGCSLEDFVNILIQLSTILQIAFEDYDFTHYDLHPNNVLLLNLGKMVSLPIHMSDGSTQYLDTWYLVVIIDLGMAHIRVDGKNYGFSYREVDVSFDCSFPAYDLFKFLLWAGYWSGESNPEIIVWIDRLSSFFDRYGRISDLYGRMEQETFFLPYDQQARRLTPADFYSFLEQEFGDVIDDLYTEKPNYEVYECASGECPNSSQILQDINALNRNAPINPYAFYDFVSSLEKSRPQFQQLARRVKIEFNYGTAIYKLATDVGAIHKTIRSLEDIKLKLPSASLFINPVGFNNYLAEIDKLGQLIEALQEYSTAVRVWNYLYQIYKPYFNKVHLLPLNKAYYNDTLNRLADYLEQLNQISNKVTAVKVKSRTIAAERKRTLIRRASRYIYLLDHWNRFLETLDL
jgi:hypothetical protein